ncbi:pentatricopeptide repeat-containing protein [Tanacetum coccineum]
MSRLTLNKILLRESYLIRAFANYAPFGFKSLHFSTNNQELDPTHSPENVDIIVRKVQSERRTEDVFDIYLSLKHDYVCNTIPISHNLVSNLLDRLKDDWKFALAVFRWAESQPNYQPLSETYDTMLDILGKRYKKDEMQMLLRKMNHDNLVTVNTITKVMRRLCEAGDWHEAVSIFDRLHEFGLEKNTESMNILLDALCKNYRVELARQTFLLLKSHISPYVHTFNIFIHGWCKVKRFDEAQGTLQELKEYGLNPSVICYSTMIEIYCQHSNFGKVYELLDEMESQNCPANVVTFTTIMSYLKRNNKYNEALQIRERMKKSGCKPDTLFYNELIDTLSRLGRVQEACDVFEVEMVNLGVEPQTSTYNSMIKMFCDHGMDQEAIRIIEMMESSNLCRPDTQTYVPLLKLRWERDKFLKTCGFLGYSLADMINK